MKTTLEKRKDRVHRLSELAQQDGNSIKHFQSLYLLAELSRLIAKQRAMDGMYTNLIEQMEYHKR